MYISGLFFLRTDRFTVTFTEGIQTQGLARVLSGGTMNLRVQSSIEVAYSGRKLY